MHQKTALFLLLGFLTCLAACGGGTGESSGVDATSSNGFLMDNGDELMDYALAFEESCLKEFREQEGWESSQDQVFAALEDCAGSCKIISNALRLTPEPERFKNILIMLIQNLIASRQNASFFIAVFQYCEEERYESFI